MTPDPPDAGRGEETRYRLLPDGELVRLCRGGEGAAFNELVVRHQDRIYNVVYRFCGNREDAGDITQRTFLNAFRKIAGFRGSSSFSTWLYRIAFNQAVSFRREQRRRERSLDAGGERPVAEAVDDRRPSEGLESEETRRKVQEILDALDETDRQVILLKDLQGCSYAEIAAILGIPPGTVRSRLHRARMDLKARARSFIGTLR